MWLLLLHFLEEYAKVFKVVFDAVEPFFLALAAGCSVWWWFRRRERIPIPEISIGLSVIPLEEGDYLAIIETRITNIGKVLLKTGGENSGDRTMRDTNKRGNPIERLIAKKVSVRRNSMVQGSMRLSRRFEEAKKAAQAVKSASE
jgi:hypothetical protein